MLQLNGPSMFTFVSINPFGLVLIWNNILHMSVQIFYITLISYSSVKTLEHSCYYLDEKLPSRHYHCIARFYWPMCDLAEPKLFLKERYLENLK